MRKWFIVLAGFTIALTIGSKGAYAQSSIGFGNGSSDNSVTFIADGAGGATLQLGSCSGTSCELSGSNGTGAGTWSLDTTLAATGQNIEVGNLSLKTVPVTSMNGAVTMFSYTNGSGGYLTGTVVWTSMITDGVATVSGTLTIGTTNLSGALGVVGNTASIDFTTNGYTLGTLSNYIGGGLSGASEGATLSSGEVVTPEPSSILLFGTGLLALGGILRRRLLA